MVAGLLVLPSNMAESAKKAPAATAAVGEDLQKTFTLLRQANDPVAQKLVTWLFATETEIAIEPDTLIKFAEENKDWPALHKFRSKIEKNIGGSTENARIISWFKEKPPTGFDGIKAYVDALIKSGAREEAKKALATFWQSGSLRKNETAALAGAYSTLFHTGAHNARLDTLIWDGRYDEAEYMLAFAGPEARKLGQTRIALAETAKNADAMVKAVPEHLQKDEGLLFERMRYRRRKDMDDGALEMLNLAPKAQKRPEKWWGEIAILARRKIEDGDYKAAHAIALRHKLKAGVEFAQAEWFLGWIELRQLNNPTTAYQRFDTMFRNVNSAISKSRAAYWAARAADELPPPAPAKPGVPPAQTNAQLAMQWYKVAAMYPSTFYGQIAFVKTYGTPTAPFSEPLITPAAKAAFAADERVRAVHILHKAKLTRFVDPFLAKLLDGAKTDVDFDLIAVLAREVERPYYTVEANKEAQQKIGKFLMREGYPTLKSLPVAQPEKSLVYAIIHRESMFDPKAQSPVGARGLMQLMPATGKSMAKKVDRTFNIPKLIDDPTFNILLGSTYLESLIDNYGGYYPMAIAAYNAGPGNVAKWVTMFGDPRKPNGLDTIDWIEHIPIYETRNYVQRVMESYFMYRLRHGQPPKTIADF